MKKIVLSLAAVATFVIASDSQAAQATANGTAEVMTPITITNTADLRFGKFSALTGGTVVIAPAGTRSATGAPQLLQNFMLARDSLFVLGVCRT